MHSPRGQSPDLQALTRILNAIVASDTSTDGQVTILTREPNPRKSTYPSEVLACQLTDGSEVRFLCKYAAESNHEAYGHRGGVAYEAEVYRHVLQSLPVSTPAFYGLHRDEITGQTWFILEYMDHSVQVNHSHDRTLMPAAARWLGQFHRANESRLSPGMLPFLHRHDAAYYLSWAARTSRFAGSLHRRFHWLATLCQRFERIVEILSEPPLIIVHGEYYPNNVLFHQGIIYPVDWESTAVAIGQIDFASLTERWPSHTVERCRAEYLSARWPDGRPADFERKLDAAKLYWQFRWLGERPEWTTEDRSCWRFDQLQTVGERLGLI
jgi:hypothetical protein